MSTSAAFPISTSPGGKWKQSFAKTSSGEVAEIRAGDVVWFAPGERHWEGATADQAMTYVAMQEAGAGGTVLFGEAVTDEQYQSGSTGG